MSHAGRCARQDDRSRLQSRALRAKAHDFWNGENQITIDDNQRPGLLYLKI